MVEGIIIWGVIWAVLAFTSVTLSVLIIGGFSVLIAGATDTDSIAVIGGILGYIVGITFGIFAIIQVVLHLIALFEAVS